MPRDTHAQTRARRWQPPAERRGVAARGAARQSEHRSLASAGQHTTRRKRQNAASSYIMRARHADIVGNPGCSRHKRASSGSGPATARVYGSDAPLTSSTAGWCRFAIMPPSRYRQSQVPACTCPGLSSEASFFVARQPPRYRFQPRHSSWGLSLSCWCTWKSYSSGATMDPCRRLLVRYERSRSVPGRGTPVRAGMSPSGAAV